MSALRQGLGRIPLIGWLLRTVVDLLQITRIREDLHRDDTRIHADVAGVQQRIGSLQAGLQERVGKLEESLNAQARTSETDVSAIRGQMGVLAEQMAAKSRARTEGHVLEQLSRLASDIQEVRRKQEEYERGPVGNLATSLPAAMREARRREVEQSQQVDLLISELESAMEEVKSLSRNFAKLSEEVSRLRTETDRLTNAALGRGSGSPNPAQPVETQLRAIESMVRELRKVTWIARGAASAAALRVNVLPGDGIKDGYLNVSSEPADGADVVAPLNDLPLPEDSVEEFLAGPALEGFSEERIGRELLSHWRRLLKPGGVLRIAVTDLDAIVREYSAGALTAGQMRDALVRSFHGTTTILNESALRSLASDAGLSDVTVVKSPGDGHAPARLTLQASKPTPDRNGG